jgi:hypothetical protein
LNIYETLALISISLLSGYLSWRFIEEKFRYKQYSAKQVFGFSFFASFILVFIALSVYLNHGYSSRISDDAMRYTDKRSMSSINCVERVKLFSDINKEFCVVGSDWNAAINKGLIWGDSHSLHWSQLFHAVGKQFDIAFVIAPEQCPPYLDSTYVKEFYPKFPTFTEQCTKKHRLTMKLLNEKKDIIFIVMAAAWSGHVRMLYDDKHKDNYLDTSPLSTREGDIGKLLSEKALRKTIDGLNLENRHVLLLSDIPRPNRSLNECYFSVNANLLREKCTENYTFLDEVEIIKWHKYSDEVLMQMSTEYSSVSSIILSDKLCTDGRCDTFIGSELIYRDGNHIRLNLKSSVITELSEIIGINNYFSLKINKK